MENNKYSAVVFDMDGTILDTLEDLAASINFALKTNDFPERSIDEVRGFVGNGLVKLVERAVPDCTLPEENQKVLETFNDYYKNHCSEKTKPYPGIIDVLNRLKKCGIKVAVCSNKPDYGVKTLCKEHFNGIFDIALGIKDGLKTKPHPDTVNEILKQLKCKKENAVYVGDSEVDIQTAKNAGIKCISVCWGFKTKDFLLQNEAERIVENAEELYNAIITTAPSM